MTEVDLGPDGDRPGLDRAAAVEAVARWGFCGVLMGTVDHPIGVLSLVPLTDAAVLAPTASLTGIWVAPADRGHGFGRQLVRAAAAELIKREVLAIEAVGQSEEMPTGFLRAVGFRVIHPNPIAPRLRMDLTTTVRHRPDLVAAWHRLAGLVPASIPPPQPAGFKQSRQTSRRVAFRPDVTEQRRPHRGTVHRSEIFLDSAQQH